MARYYFDLLNNGEDYRDEEGQEIGNVDLVREQAELHAKDILAEFMHDHHEVGDQTIEVRDHKGNYVTSVPIKIVMGLDWDDIEKRRQ